MAANSVASQPGRHDGGEGEVDAAVAHPGAQGGGAADRAGQRAGAEPGVQAGHGRDVVGLLVGRADGVGAQVDEADRQPVEQDGGDQGGEAAGQGQQYERGPGTGETDHQDRAAAGPVGQRPAGEQGDQAGRGGDGDGGAERRRVEAQARRQRRELDGPDADVEAEDGEQAGGEQVMRTALTGARRYWNNGLTPRGSQEQDCVPGKGRAGSPRAGCLPLAELSVLLSRHVFTLSRPRGGEGPNSGPRATSSGRSRVCMCGVPGSTS